LVPGVFEPYEDEIECIICDFGNLIEIEHFKHDPIKFILRFCGVPDAYNLIFRAAKITKDLLLRIPELAINDMKASDQLFAATLTKIRRIMTNIRGIPHMTN
jgi:hypothetical protein